MSTLETVAPKTNTSNLLVKIIAIHLLDGPPSPQRERPLAPDFSIGHNGGTPLADFDAFFTSAIKSLTPIIYEPAQPR
jgi:hypothetical protein